MENKKIDCKLCNGTGYIIYQREIEGKKYDYAAVCKCGNAEQYMGKEFYTPLAEELNLI